MLDYTRFYRRHLPHFQPNGATLFVTFRLAGSLPKGVAERLQAESELVRAQIARCEPATASKLYEEYRRAFGRFDSHLDAAAYGPRWLEQPEVARLVADALCARDGVVLDMAAYCIMPNHVHAVFSLRNDGNGVPFALQKVMQSLKAHTARAANWALARSGAFWQHESYDHVVRDGGELERIVAYVVNNPVKAGLVATAGKWPWTFVKS